LVQKFERTYRNARTLQATFLERYLDNGRELRSEAGTAYFGRPGKMRWEYTSPEHNLYVVDGKWSWFYVPSDRTVTRIQAKESGDWRTPLALLAGEMKVSRICSRVSSERAVTPLESGNVVLRCELRSSDAAAVPAAASQKDLAETVLFEVNSSTGSLTRVLVSNPGAIQMDFGFTGWQFDPKLGPAMFRFEPPKGVVIVDGHLAQGGHDHSSGGPGVVRCGRVLGWPAGTFLETANPWQLPCNSCT